jgi:hypothetical protein
MPDRNAFEIDLPGAPSRGRRLVAGAKTALLTGACATAAGALLAGPALASPTPEGGVRDGNHIVVVPNIDLVGAFGDSYQVGEEMTIDVIRGGNTIASVTAPAYDVEGEPGLEINHGPEGLVRPGDCFEQVTPDVRPGDRIRVTDSSGGVDQAMVDDISIDSVADDPASNDVLVRGVARYATGGALGGPIPSDVLDSGFWRTRNVPSGDARGDTPEVTVDPSGQYTARYSAPTYEVFRGGPVTQADVLGADHEFGYGHTEPPPAEIQLVDGVGQANGPAVGCEAAPAAGRDAITTSSDDTVKVGTGPLVLGGTASAGTTGVSVEVSDRAGNTVDVDATPSLFEGMSGEQSWSASISETEIEGLVAGRLTVTATFENGVVPTATWELLKGGPVVSFAPGSPSGLIADSTPTFTFSADEPATFECRVDSAPFGPCPSPFETGELRQGDHRFAVRGTDTAGNTGVAAARAFHVDTVGPEMALNRTNLRMTRDGEVQTRLTCPPTELAGPCTGLLRLRSGGDLLGSAEYTIDPGRREDVNVQLTNAGRNLVSRRGTVSGRAVIRTTDALANVATQNEDVTIVAR